jgi:hypothetical protein
MNFERIAEHSKLKELLNTKSLVKEDISYLIKEGVDILIHLTKGFDVLFQPIRTYESNEDYEKEKAKMRQTFEDLMAYIDQTMPSVQKSIANLTWDPKDYPDRYIESEQAKDFIEKANLRIPIIQNGFDKLGAQSMNYLSSINDLIDELNKKNKDLPKKPVMVLRPIHRLLNHFTRKKESFGIRR